MSLTPAQRQTLAAVAAGHNTVEALLSITIIGRKAAHARMRTAVLAGRLHKAVEARPGQPAVYALTDQGRGELAAASSGRPEMTETRASVLSILTTLPTSVEGLRALLGVSIGTARNRIRREQLAGLVVVHTARGNRTPAKFKTTPAGVVALTHFRAGLSLTGDQQQLVLYIDSEGGPVTAADIAHEYSASGNVAREWLASCVEAGVVELLGRRKTPGAPGFYGLTQRGRDAVTLLTAARDAAHAEALAAAAERRSA